MTKRFKKYLFFLTAFLTGTVSIISSGLFEIIAFAQTCPPNTIVQERQATLVGEITDDGGDPNSEVWFQYGRSSSYGHESSRFSKFRTGLFCATVYNLDPCTTYHYRAAARNSAGTSFGANKTFTTRCAPAVTIDIKANSSDGPLTLHYRDNVTLSWTSQNAAFCEASGDWSGTKAASGSETIRLASVRTHTFNIICRDTAGTRTATDLVQVVVRSKPPTVITKPAIVTH